ncbi:Leucine carboxyl methyltransferase family protein [Histomonas meleagridis]|uniref:Leucine carboxyl methyltransferase family protein n=1 Tax=Histomonas meleagridis TaxID=135588 RepID=UPI00355A602C|nr:Leucine carboxyl methyltransferase family protein [Histomonas meleagridis]KAH0802887.1 Leucine carboxyl methyltransferase family protein [Histomonas meleagridis]
MSYRELNSVEDTALDAANSKLCAVSRGYYDDPYIGYFVPYKVNQLPPMNLGYYVRSLSMLEAIKKFHELHGESVQVVILGCGYDTLFWRLRDMGIKFSKWYDLDLPFIVKKKGPIISSNSIFHPVDNYFLIECDLSKENSVEESLLKYSFDINSPTIFVDECTLIYVDPFAVDKIIKFAGSLKSSAFISYGMIKPNDQFGQMMVKNFDSFGAPLKGIARYPTVESHKERFLNGGYANVKAADMNVAMRSVPTQQDILRVRRLEMQDDPDELAFMLSHYVLVIASTDNMFMTLLP